MLLLLPLSGLILLLGVLYLPVLQNLVQVWWTDPNYSHGFLIPFVVGYLLWRQKEVLSEIPVQPSRWGGLVLLLGLLLFLLGAAVETVAYGLGGLFVKGVSLILVLGGLVIFLLGKPFLKLLTFPLAYLVFMIPLPGTLFTTMTFPLQVYTTSVTTTVLQLFHIPVLREGNLIHLPAITLGIVEACSGIRSLLTLLAGGIALSYLTQTQWWQRLILLGSIVPIAIVTNAFRVTSTGFLAYFWGGEMAQSFFHGFSGWLLLTMASLLLCTEVLILTKLSSEEE